MHARGLPDVHEVVFAGERERLVQRADALEVGEVRLAGEFGGYLAARLVDCADKALVAAERPVDCAPFLAAVVRADERFIGRAPSTRLRRRT
jgi:hypothetical protein